MTTDPAHLNPNCASTGAEIRSILQERFTRILGPERGSEVWRRLRNDIAIEFDLFGDSTQDLLATVERSDGNEIIRIERTRNWLASEASSFSTRVDLFDARQLEGTDCVYMAPLLRRLLEAKDG